MARERAKRRDSETSRAAILSAARERFAAEGYERATVRAIAGDAGIDPAMVIRYFGSKEQLFAEAADFDLRVPDFSDVPRTRLGAALVEHFIERWEEDDTLMALLRAAATNESAAKRLRTVFGSQVVSLLSTISDDPQTAIRAGLVASQMLGFALCRYLLRLPPIAAMSRADAVANLAPAVQRYITGKVEAAR